MSSVLFRSGQPPKVTVEKPEGQQFTVREEWRGKGLFRACHYAVRLADKRGVLFEARSRTDADAFIAGWRAALQKSKP